MTDISCGVVYEATLASLVLFRSYCYVILIKSNFESNYAKPSYGMAFHSPANFLAVCVNYFLTIFSGGTFWVSHADHQCVTTE